MIDKLVWMLTQYLVVTWKLQGEKMHFRQENQSCIYFSLEQQSQH